MRIHETVVDVAGTRGLDLGPRTTSVEIRATYDGETRRRVKTWDASRFRIRNGLASTTTADDCDVEDDATTTVYRRSEGRARVLRRSDAGVRVEAIAQPGERSLGFCVARETVGNVGVGEQKRKGKKTDSATDAAVERYGGIEGRWMELRGKGGGTGGEIFVSVATRVIHGEEAEAKKASRVRAKEETPKRRYATGYATGNDDEEEEEEDGDEEARLPTFDAHRVAVVKPTAGGSSVVVHESTHAFELTLCVESFERIGATSFDSSAPLTANVGADDVLAKILGLNVVDASCLIRTAPSGRVKDVDGVDETEFERSSGSIRFSCAPTALATTLAGKPCVLLDVWSSKDESRVASANIAIDELLRRQDVRYRAEVTDDRGVVVGRARLRVRLDSRGSLTERQPASTPKRTGGSRKKIDADGMRELSPAPVPSAQKPPPPACKVQRRHVALPPSRQTSNVAQADPRAGVEYKVAYDLEVWKQHEMTKFHDELANKEAARMRILEDEWRRHEARRNREMEEATQRLRTMERKLQQAAAALEGRERKLVELEEHFEHRKHKLERETSRVREEAKDSVERNQETCNHKVEIERQKAREAIRERDAIHLRLEHAEANLTQIEVAFAAHKKASLETNEATLQAEVSRLAPRCEAAEARAEEEAALKERYKKQLTKMARQVVALERERAHSRRAMERAGLNLSHRSQMAPSANEFMNDILSGDGEDSDAFMRGFKADVAAVSMNGTIGGDNVAKPQVARPNLRAVEDYRMPLPSKLDKIDEEAGGGAKGEKDVRARLAPDVAQSDTMAEKRAAEREVRRLVTERGDLMRTGMYGSGDKIISLIDERIEELTDRIAST